MGKFIYQNSGHLHFNSFFTDGCVYISYEIFIYGLPEEAANCQVIYEGK